MQVYGVRTNTLYERNIRINSGDKNIEVTRKPYMLQISKDKDGNIIVGKKYIDSNKRRVVKQI